MNPTNDKPVVLLVDDVAANIQLVANFLNDQYRIKVATEGKKSLQLAVTEPIPDLILLDIEMPVMDGYEVCRALKQDAETADIPIIFVTAKDDDAEEELGLELGAVDYITKPLRPAIVRARVNAHITLKQQRDQLQKMALIDQLTHLYNRHYLIETAPLKIANAIRHESPLCMVMIDIDFFKSVNDLYGHDKGDKVLQAVAGVIKANTRQGDIAARLGGEEFLLLLDHCDIEAAISKIEFIRNAIEELKPEGINVTASFGVTKLMDHDDDFDSFYKRADKAVYLAKDNGRNRIEIS
ncbi:diguanylate cyclase [Aliikangiella marina]|uniref:diguanylate cyclase n=1 Tax=Aliikangiella marina TaxID=1712262 RepID=A0A545T7L2_9GAMM|nr:diguanylate cyclase [Aliikangiella marina]TQV73188.1 diguanylate cyclase [Aliikangiella marina]